MFLNICGTVPYTGNLPSHLLMYSNCNNNGDLTYDTPITNDVLGYLSDKDVTEVLIKIQQL